LYEPLLRLPEIPMIFGTRYEYRVRTAAASANASSVHPERVAVRRPL
jgi:hypothetical protein